MFKKSLIIIKKRLRSIKKRLHIIKTTFRKTGITAFPNGSSSVPKRE